MHRTDTTILRSRSFRSNKPLDFSGSDSFALTESLWGKTKNGYLPNLGKIAWEAPPTCSFRSYVFQCGNTSYVFIRFHTYKMGAEERLKAIADVDEAISKFQEHNVRGVVLDQTGNAGGHFLFAYSLLSHFIKTPLRPPCSATS